MENPEKEKEVSERQIGALAAAGLSSNAISTALGTSQLSVKAAMTLADEVTQPLELSEEEQLCIKRSLFQDATLNPDPYLRAKVGMFLYDRHHVSARDRYKAKTQINNQPNIVLVQQVLNEARQRASS